MSDGPKIDGTKTGDEDDIRTNAQDEIRDHAEDVRIPAPADPFAGRMRAAVIALASHPGDDRTRASLAAMLGYGPGAQQAFDGIVSELAERRAMDRRAVVMLRSLATRVRKLEAVDDRTLLVNALTADAPANDEDTVIWNEGAGSEDIEETGPAHGRAPGEGDTINGRFELKALVGVGGMAVVFRAYDRQTNHDVAIKILKDAFLDTPGTFDAFNREAKRTAAIDHPGVVTIIASGVHDDRPYTVMEYLDGTPLSQMLNAREGRSVTWARTLDFVNAVGSSLAAAHAKGIVHCDLKPSNLFQLSDGSWRVIDFGVAQEIRGSGMPMPERKSAAQDIAYEPPIEALTPAYASPEQLRHMGSDARDDIFSLAVITYEMLTGLHPFDRLPADKAGSRRLQPPRPDKLPTRAWKTLRCGLAFERERRPKSMTAFVRGLRRPRPIWPLIVLMLAIAVGGAAVIRPDLAAQAVRDVELGVKAAVIYFEDDERAIQIALDLKAQGGPLGQNAVRLARPLLVDRIRAMAQVDSEAPSERLRLTNWAVGAGRMLYPDDATLEDVAERPFRLLLFDLADRLGLDETMPGRILVEDVTLLRGSNPLAYAGLEDVIVDLILERLRKMRDPLAAKALTDTARELFPQEQWVEPTSVPPLPDAAPTGDLSTEPLPPPAQ
jgi:hypothetical protein